MLHVDIPVKSALTPNVIAGQIHGQRLPNVYVNFLFVIKRTVHSTDKRGGEGGGGAQERI